MQKYNPVTPAIVEKLKAIVGDANVTVDLEKMEPYAHDEVTDTRYHKNARSRCLCADG